MNRQIVSKPLVFLVEVEPADEQFEANFSLAGVYGGGSGLAPGVLDDDEWAREYVKDVGIETALLDGEQALSTCQADYYLVTGRMVTEECGPYDGREIDEFVERDVCRPCAADDAWVAAVNACAAWGQAASNDGGYLILGEEERLAGQADRLLNEALNGPETWTNDLGVCLR